MSAPTISPGQPDLDRLEALARAATPGPWAYQEDSDAYTHIIRPVASPGWIIASGTQTSKPEGEANGRWIAAANPAAVLALIALARRAQPEGLSIALREVTDKLSATAAENLSLNMENRQLREQLAERAQPEGEVIPGKHAVFPINLLGNPMREYNHGRWESAIWPSNQTEGKAPQADTPAPSAAAMDDVVDNLREYASNAGYSHNDYQDTMRQAANTIEALRAQLWHWGPFAAQQAAAPGALADNLRRTLDNIKDPTRLADVRSLANLGQGFLDAAPSAPSTPKAPADENAKRYLWLRDHAMGFDQVGRFTPYVVVGQVMRPLEGKALDQAVDVARAAQLDGGQEGSESNG